MMEVCKQFPRSNINILFDNGGIGDHVAAMPVIKYAMEAFPYVTWYLWVPDYFLDFARNVLPNCIIRPFSKKDKFTKEWPSRRISFGLTYTNLRSHMTEHCARILLNQDIPDGHKNYLKLNLDKINIDKFKLPNNYVVITTGYTAPIREFLGSYINELTDYVIKKGYIPVFLGKRQSPTGFENKSIIGHFNEEISYKKGIDLIDKTSLLEAGKIIAGSKCIIGLDNGLLHVAAGTDVNIIGGFTSVDPIHRLPYRDNVLGKNYSTVVPPNSEPEKFFQSRYDFLFEHDYKESYFKNNDLIKSLKPELWIEKLKEIL